MDTRRITLPIFGLTCSGGGALTLERALERAPGVVWVYINPATEMAYVEYDAALATPSELVAVVEEVGLRAGEPGFR